MARRYVLPALMLAGVILLAAGCAKEVDNVVLGTWQGDFREPASTVVFTSGGNYSIEPGGETGTYEIRGTSMTLQPDSGESYTMECDVENGGNTLVIEEDGESYTLEKSSAGAVEAPAGTGQDATEVVPVQ